jgi:hypothetical protein
MRIHHDVQPDLHRVNAIQERRTMRTKRMPLIEEAPLIVIGFAAATIGAAVYAAVLGATRVVLHMTGTDHEAPTTH